jgi:hypothetical protein
VDGSRISSQASAMMIVDTWEPSNLVEHPCDQQNRVTKRVDTAVKGVLLEGTEWKKLCYKVTDPCGNVSGCL